MADFQDPASWNPAWHSSEIQHGNTPYEEMQRIEREGVGDPGGAGQYDVVNGSFMPANADLPVAFPGGSPTNYWLISAHVAHGFNDITPYSEKKDYTGPRGADGYWYTMRQADGKGVAATYEQVLSAIGRTHGQTG